MNQFLKHKGEITGCGILSSIGVGKQQFSSSLKNGISNFSTLSFEINDDEYIYPTALIDEFVFKEIIENLPVDRQLIKKANEFRNISFSTSCAIYCALEAWADSGLNAGNVNLERVAIIAAGTNTQQAMLTSVREQYSSKLHFLNPNYGINFFDTDIVGVLSQLFSIKGEGYALGASSASGNMAIMQGNRLIVNGEYDVVLVVSPMMDISKYEYQAFTALGAMTRITKNGDASVAIRPFDKSHSGFVYGQSSGCIIIESETHAKKRSSIPYGSIAGHGSYLDGNRNPNPATNGESIAISRAIKNSNIQPHEIDYINTHGTGSVVGDAAEVNALIKSGLSGVKANSTKSINGHGLSAAGVIECIATLMQMKGNFIHPSLNLINPISHELDWVTSCRENTRIKNAISNCFGFGGVNTSIVIQNKL